MVTFPVTKRPMQLLWVLVLAAAMLLEGYALGARNGATLSVLVRDQMRHPVGRFVYYPLWAWLTYHWFLASGPNPTWRDLIYVGIGLLAAGVTTLLGH